MQGRDKPLHFFLSFFPRKLRKNLLYIFAMNSNNKHQTTNDRL